MAPFHMRRPRSPTWHVAELGLTPARRWGPEAPSYLPAGRGAWAWSGLPVCPGSGSLGTRPLGSHPFGALGQGRSAGTLVQDPSSRGRWGQWWVL